MPFIVFDPGHGGFDSGAIGCSGLQEKDVTLPICLRFRGLFGDAAEVKLTRIKDVALGVTVVSDCYARAKTANQCNADVFVSIHCNASPDPHAHGIEVWTSPGDTGADKLATCVMDALHKEFPDLAVREDMTDGDVDKEARFIVLMATKMPAVLVELPFISNPKEEMLLKDAGFQKRAAHAIAEGIAEYLGIKLPEEWDPEKEIAKLRERGVITGEHKPRDPVTWGEFATVINRLRRESCICRKTYTD